MPGSESALAARIAAAFVDDAPIRFKAVREAVQRGDTQAASMEIQYCSTYYQALHRRHGIQCSMTDGCDCYQNALAERVNGILKGELLLARPSDLDQARRMVAESIQIYSTERAHLSSKMQTPDAVHRASIAGQARHF